MDKAAYEKLMEQAPRIKASGLEGDYRALAEFNNIVLAGHQTKYEMEFVTWEWVQNHTALWQGHYTDSYDAAKRDFATRSGLLPPEQLFSDQQLAEVYRCVHETLESDYSITMEREKLLTGIVDQIETTVPSLDELVQRSNNGLPATEKRFILCCSVPESRWKAQDQVDSDQAPGQGHQRAEGSERLRGDQEQLRA